MTCVIYNCQGYIALTIHRKAYPLSSPVPWKLFHLWTMCVHLSFPGEESPEPSIQEACFPSPVKASPIHSHFRLTLNSPGEPFSWSWGPKAASSSSAMSPWSGRGSACHRYSCPSCGSGKLAHHRCYGLCPLWGWLRLKGLCAGAMGHLILGGTVLPGSPPVQPAGFHSTDL